MYVDLDSIKDIIGSYADLDVNRLYFGSDIPQEILITAQEKFPITNTERAYMFYDSSTDEDGETGIAICDNGVFYKNDKLNKPCYRHFLWEEFYSLDIFIKESNIFLGSKYYVHISTAKETMEAIEALLKEIQQSLLEDVEYDEDLEETDGDRLWRIILEPMNSPQIEKLLNSSFFDPEYALVQYGEDDLRPYNSIPELKALTKGLNKKRDQFTLAYDNNKYEENKKININTCKAEDLLSIACMDMQRINCLMEKRRSGNKFYTLDDIAELLDLKPHEVEELKDKIEINMSSVRRIEF